MHATSKMDCTHYETAMNKESVIEKLYFMLSRLVNEGLHVVRGGDCCVCASFVLIQCYAKASSHPPFLYISLGKLEMCTNGCRELLKNV